MKKNLLLFSLFLLSFFTNAQCNCNLLGDNFFTGDYVVSQTTPGPFGYALSTDGSDVTVTLSAVSQNERLFSAIYLPDFSNTLRPYTLDFSDCETTFLPNQSTGLSCTSGILYALGPNAGGSYFNIDDTSFTVVYQEDSLGSCVDPPSSSVVTLTFTKANGLPSLISIPDPNFEQALIDLSIDDTLDGTLDASATPNVGALNLTPTSTASSIQNLTGIEAFVNLQILNLQNSNLSTVDLSQNCILNGLTLTGNPQLTNLDLSKNTNLTNIDLRNNGLTSLNIQNGSNTNLVASLFGSFNTLNNSGLGCIQVDDVAFANTNFTAFVDPQTSFNIACSDDYDALLALYNSTNGANWTNTWDLNLGVNTFYGVTLDANNRVIAIQLNDNNLVGTLPTELGDLTNLDVLSLSSNQLTGAIPDELSNLSNLTNLILFDNQLSGNIPSSLGNITSLLFLELSQNSLTGTIPTEIGNLSNLTLLSLVANQLTGTIPSELGNLSSLLVLSLTSNQLTGEIPSALGNLSNLQFLELGINSLSGSIPPSLGNLTNLSELYLFANELSGTIPSEMGNLTSLTDLALGSNNFSGTIPSEMNNLTNSLTFVTFRNNNFVFLDLETIFTQYQTISTFSYAPQNTFGFAETIDVDGGDIIFLNSLFIDIASTNNTYQWFKDDVAIDGATNPSLTIANATGSDAGVYVLRANNTVITGLELESEPITVTVNSSTDYDVLVALYNSTGGPNWTNTWDLSADISTFFGVTLDTNNKVTSIVLNNNNLVGTLPTELGNLTNLVSLFLPDNQLTGNIPIELGNLNSLTTLFLNNNNLTGNIPTEFGDLVNLESLFLSDNQLTGDIPTEIGNLNGLTTLFLNNNNLTGIIPSQFADLTSLRALFLADNQLTGDFPIDITNLTSLEQLFLNNNDLTGEIPNEIGNLTQLLQLYLGGNNFSGSIPGTLGSLTNLQALRLSDNALTGTIPSSLTDLANLTELDLKINQLTGSIPNEIGNLTNLTVLSLRNNSLSGTIPTEIGNLTNLNSLLLSFNNLSGTIPTEIGNLTNLTGLGMRSNALTGNIPTELGNLSNLETLSLRFNQLEGIIPSELGNLTNLQTLSLGNNQFSGTLPTELGNLNNLSFFDIQGNIISGIPETLNSLVNLTSLNISNNDFLFLDIETIFTTFQSQALPVFTYAPQNTFGFAETIDVDSGDPIFLNSLFTDIASNTNTYQWFKDDVAIDGATGPSLEIASATASDAGVYILRVNNTFVTGLELESETITVNVSVDPNYMLVTDTTLLVNDTGDVDIQLINSVDIRGIQFDITFPTGFAFNTNDLVTTSRIADFQTSISDLGNNTYRVLSFSPNTTIITPGDEAVLILPTLVNDGTVAGDYAFEITNVVISDQAAQDVTTTPELVGVITVTEFPLGDSNGSGAVDILDLLQNIDFILGNNPSPFVFNAADVNMDMNINILDVLGIQDIILNPNSSPQNEATRMPMENYLVLDSKQVLQDETTNIDLRLVNGDEIRALQFDINVPSGFSLDPNTISALGRLSGFNVSSSSLGNNTFRVLAFSFTGETIAPGNESILRLPVTVGGATPLGDYTFAITNVVLSDVSNQDVSSTPLSVGTIEVVDTLGTDENILDTNTVNMYPNPTHDFINLNISNADFGVIDFNLYDMTGKLVNKSQIEKTETIISTKINVSQLAEGIYILNIKTQNSSISKRIIISQ